MKIKTYLYIRINDKRFLFSFNWNVFYCHFLLFTQMHRRFWFYIFSHENTVVVKKKRLSSTICDQLPQSLIIIRFVELCLPCCEFFHPMVLEAADTAAAVGSNWIHVWWKNRPGFVGRAHACSGRELSLSRGHDPSNQLLPPNAHATLPSVPP